MSPEGRLWPSRRAVATFVAFVPAFLAGAGVLALTSKGSPPLPPPSEQALEAPASDLPSTQRQARRFVTGRSGQPADPSTIRPLQRRPAKPASISIPSARIESDVVEVGAADDGILVPPAAQVGWFRLGPRPGEIGRAIVIGHLDSAEGTAAFTSLTAVEEGGRVVVIDREGERHPYEVAGMLDVAKSDFQAEQVYESRGRAELVLITCGGAFDPDTGYADNLIVFARAV